MYMENEYPKRDLEYSMYRRISNSQSKRKIINDLVKEGYTKKEIGDMFSFVSMDLMGKAIKFMRGLYRR